jgi:hypothetical protein
VDRDLVEAAQCNPDWTGTCPPTPDDPPDLGDVRTRGILLDAPDRGVIVIFVGSMYSADFEAFLADAMPSAPPAAASFHASAQTTCNAERAPSA